MDGFNPEESSASVVQREYTDRENMIVHPICHRINVLLCIRAVYTADLQVLLNRFPMKQLLYLIECQPVHCANRRE